MSILSFIKDIINPVTKVIDAVHTSDEERLILRNELAKMEHELAMRFMEMQSKVNEAKANIITAEAKGGSWLQRNWRPMTMMMFVFIIFWNFIIAPIFNLKFLPLTGDIWDVIKLGLGGYIGARTVDKGIEQVTGYLNKKNGK